MPKPVPPPPPQPTEAETRDAVRLLRWITLAALASFLLYARTYGLHGPLVEYGRSEQPSWILWRIDQLNEAGLRAHPGGRVVWLVGSSILRESFDEDAINAELAQRDSVFRVYKLGMNRGATGIAEGILEHLPVREGDIVLHSVGMENYLADWLDATGLPWWQVTMLAPTDLWMASGDWTWQRKLEILCSWPRDYWWYQEEAATGWQRVFESPWDGWPTRRKSNVTLHFHTYEREPAWARRPPSDVYHPYYLHPSDIDMSEGQFNMMGLVRMRAFVAARGARLVLADIPPRQEYQDKLMAPSVREQWERWRDAQPETMKFPQIPDDDYYDMKHPNFRGRAWISHILVNWIAPTGR